MPQTSVHPRFRSKPVCGSGKVTRSAINILGALVQLLFYSTVLEQTDKPNPCEFVDPFYTFETWASQLNDFCNDVVSDKAFFICNSIGGIVGLQAAVLEPGICKGVVVLNISLRMLHVKKQPWYGRRFIRSFQSLLSATMTHPR
ncbi:unnamed protein product [Cuscuta epithymum]|uniref:Uncharacterized protein n=1 Tax=Cuscuta epithymum TaxID=186058 RepID=A0AAV0C3F5_9ASTE|nr:unnamed protein product [Cuscuta epithymum]